MDFLPTLTTDAIPYWLLWGYVLLWVLALNSALLTPKTWRGRGFFWVLALAITCAFGIWVDQGTYTQPHQAYAMWEFWATFVLTSATFSLPALLAIWWRRG